MKSERAQKLCIRIGWVLLATTVCALPFVMLRFCFSFHIVVYTSFLAMTCAFLAKKSTALCWLSTIVFIAALLGLTMLGLIQDRVYYGTQTLADAIASRDLQLIKRKINDYSPNGRSKYGRTMLTMACTLPSPREQADPRELAQIAHDILKLLLEHGAAKTLNQLDAYAGMAPIHYLASPSYYYPEDQVKLLTLLISNGADVNIKDKKGNTPLHIAVSHRAPIEIITVLLEHGADVNAKNSVDQTPLQIAIEQGNTEIANLLRQHGAKE